MRSSNPVLSRLGEVARAQRQVGYPPPQGYTVPQGYAVPAGHAIPGYPSVLGPSGVSRSMTIDDVVTRAAFLIAVTVATAAVSWFALRTGPLVGLATAGSAIAGLVLVLVISFARVTNPAVISLYAVCQGTLLGVVSREFEYLYPGVVVQAVAGTLAVFIGMAVLYHFRVLRATPRFTRFVIGALLGVVALSLVNVLLSVFGRNLGVEYYSPSDHPGMLAIVFSLACIAIGALTFIVDFDAVEQGIRYGLPERYAWYCAFGILVGLIYLYWQILRLLGYLRR